MNKKQVFWLAAKTFIQAFVGYLGSTTVTDDMTLRIVIAAAIACGMSALMNIDWQKVSSTTSTTETKIDDVAELVKAIASVDWNKLIKTEDKAEDKVEDTKVEDTKVEDEKGTEE